MKNVSQTFKDSVKDTNALRNIHSKIQFYVGEEVTENDCTITTNNYYVGDKWQCFDGIDTQLHWASFDSGRFKLDGSCVLPSYSFNKYKYGLISTAVSDNSGNITAAIEVDFGVEKTFKGMILTFDSEVYELDIVLDHISWTSYTISTDNKKIIIDNEFTCSSFTVGVTKAKALSHIWLVQIQLGQTLEYTDQEIESLTIIDEKSLDNTALPSSETDVTILDIDRLFDILNHKGIYRYIKQFQVLKAYFGVETNKSIEWAQMGKYYLDSVKSGNGKVTFVAYDVINMLDKTDYVFGSFEERTLYAMISELLYGYDYDIDSSLATISVVGYIPVVTKREALRYMLQAGCMVLTVSENGKILIGPRADMQNRNTYLNYSGERRTGEIYTERSIQEQNKYIDSDNMKDYPTIEQKSPYSSVLVKVNSYTVSTESKTKTYTACYTMIDGAEQKVWVSFEKPMKNITLVGPSKYEIHSNGCYVWIYSSSSFIVTGYEVEIKTTDYSKTQTDKYVNECSVSNPLISSNVLASKLADYTLNSNDLSFNVDYRGFIYLDSGDSIVVETEYGNKELIITRQNFSYSGYLSGQLEGRGSS